LTNKYSLIYDRDKIKFIYLKTPNPSLSPVIAAPRHLPKELNLDKFIDYDLMFEKTFLNPITSILDAIGWNVSDNSTLEGFFE
jgi:DNA polymerase elongation subunit (family B)